MKERTFTFTVLTLLKVFEKNLTRQPFHAFKRGSFDGDHFISCTGTDAVPDRPNFGYHFEFV